MGNYSTYLQYAGRKVRTWVAGLTGQDIRTYEGMDSYNIL